MYIQCMSQEKRVGSGKESTLTIRAQLGIKAYLMLAVHHINQQDYKRTTLTDLVIDAAVEAANRALSDRYIPAKAEEYVQRYERVTGNKLRK
jgi:uncharacterized protein (DUF1778 family)